MKAAWLACSLLSLALLGSGCSPQDKARSIRPGMTCQEVVRIMGKPSIGWGLPESGAGESLLSYEIYGNRYLVVRFWDDRVADPPTGIWSKYDLVE